MRRQCFPTPSTPHPQQPSRCTTCWLTPQRSHRAQADAGHAVGNRYDRHTRGAKSWMPATDLNPSHRTCAVVGNGGVLLRESNGHAIDQAEAVFRFNDGPTVGCVRPARPCVTPAHLLLSGLGTVRPLWFQLPAPPLSRSLWAMYDGMV